MMETEYPNNRYPDGAKVRVTDVGRDGRKYLGKVLWVERLAEDGSPDAWEVELRNGNRGSYDLDHIETAP
jgi:hypothetical protein